MTLAWLEAGVIEGESQGLTWRMLHWRGHLIHQGSCKVIWLEVVRTDRGGKRFKGQALGTCQGLQTGDGKEAARSGTKKQPIGEKENPKRMVVQRDTGGGENDLLCQMLQIL